MSPAPAVRRARPAARWIVLAVLLASAATWWLREPRPEAVPEAAAPPARAGAGPSRAGDAPLEAGAPAPHERMERARPDLVGHARAVPALHRVRGKAVDESGAPVGGVVLLLLDVEPVPAASALPPGVVSARTGSRFKFQPHAEILVGADGRFEVEAPAGAALLLRVEAEGWLPAAARLVPDAEAEVVMPLVRPRRVEGVALDLVTGRPLGGVRVTGQPQGASAWPTALQAVVTQPDGSFTLDGLPPGPVAVQGHLQFRSEAGAALEAARRVPPADLGSTGPVVVEAGTAERLTLRVWAGFRIEGQVRGPAGRPVLTPLRLSLYARDDAGRPNPRARVLATPTADGAFSFIELPRGPFDLHVEPRGPDEDGTLLAPTWVRGVPSGSTGVQVELAAGVRVRVRRVEPDGGPIASTEGWVLVEPEEEPEGSPDGTTATWDGSAWVSEPLSAGRRYRVLAGGVPGRARGRAGGVVPGPDAVPVVLEPAGGISGRVLTAESAPAPRGVPVRAWREEPGADVRLAEAAAYALTDAEGRFRLEGLGQGPHRLAAGGAGSTWAPSSSEGGVTVEGPECTLRVAPGATLSGRLIQPAGSALGALLLAYGADALPTTLGRTSSADGLFLLSGLPRGPVTLALRRGNRVLVLGTYTAPGARLRVIVRGG